MYKTTCQTYPLEAWFIKYSYTTSSFVQEGKLQRLQFIADKFYPIDDWTIVIEIEIWKQNELMLKTDKLKANLLEREVWEICRWLVKWEFLFQSDPFLGAKSWSGFFRQRRSSAGSRLSEVESLQGSWSLKFAIIYANEVEQNLRCYAHLINS